jgi:hypothetical protein
MEEIIKIFQDYANESDENREKAVLGAIKILVKLNQDRTSMKNQIINANRETRRKNKGLFATKQVICNYIDLVELVLKAKSEEQKSDGEDM